MLLSTDIESGPAAFIDLRRMEVLLMGIHGYGKSPRAPFFHVVAHGILKGFMIMIAHVGSHNGESRHEDIVIVWTSP